jgi:nitrile hydratase accessory protein
LSESEVKLNVEDPASLARIPRDHEGPVFAEPWQAQAFAIAVKLSEKGYFTWKEWASALADELKAAAERGEPDDGSHYYEHWLAALERMVALKGLSNPDALLERKNAWADAYRHTPHGKTGRASARPGLSIGFAREKDTR